MALRIVCSHLKLPKKLLIRKLDGSSSNVPNLSIDHAGIATESGNATPPPQPLPDATFDNSNADGAAIPSSKFPSSATTSEEAVLDDVRAPTATDTIIPNSQASANGAPSSDPNQSSSSLF